MVYRLRSHLLYVDQTLTLDSAGDADDHPGGKRLGKRFFHTA